jgi:integrase
MLEAAVDDERIARNPAKGARLAKAETVPFVPMTVDQVRAVAAAMAEPVRAGVLVVAGTGLRQGELFGLSVDRVDFMRRELRVDRQLFTPGVARS